MENPLWADIQAQGENLRHVVDHLYGAERRRLEAAAQFLHNGKPVVFTGMASAAYTCVPSQFYLGQQGRYAGTIGASDALYSLLPALSEANVVINSRSGETAEIVKLGQALVEAGVPFLAVTNEPESTLARQATHILWSNTRKDDLVSINVVTGMTVTCLALCAEVVGQLDALRPDLDKLADAMDDAVAQAVREADEITELFAETRPLYLLYRGARQAAALCGRLVLEEVARRPAVPLESGEFRQGPNEVVDGDFGAILFAASGEMAALDLRLAQDIRACGGRVLVVGSAEISKRLLGLGIPSFPVAPLPLYLSPIVELAPVQLLAYKSAERQGYAPGTVRYITKVITSEAGIPNQVQQ
jgi:glucosamine--fructose-6-phosphate aminotransferase (isomerizing)